MYYTYKYTYTESNSPNLVFKARRKILDKESLRKFVNP